MRLAFLLALLIPLPAVAGTAADIARAIRENSFDRDECYRVRDLTLVKEDIRHLLHRRPPDLQQAGGRHGASPRCSPPTWRAATAK